MSADEPEVDRHRERAVADLARLLHGRLLPGMDAGHIARQALDLLCEDHDYRRVPRSPRIPDQSGQGDYASGAAAAREALARARAKVEGEQHS